MMNTETNERTQKNGQIRGVLDPNAFVHISSYISIPVIRPMDHFWLVVSNIFHFPFHIWDNPFHWLIFSRWLKPPTSYLMPLNPMIFQVSMASIPEITIVKTTNQSWFQHQPICFDQKIPDFEAKLGPSRGSCRLGLLAMPVSAGGTYQVRLLRTARGPVPPQPRWPGGSGDFMGI